MKMLDFMDRVQRLTRCILPLLSILDMWPSHPLARAEGGGGRGEGTNNQHEITNDMKNLG